MYSLKLNQIIAVKFPNREHYITKGIARQYLQSTRKTIFSELDSSICENAYVLNVLISSRLTKSCFELITSGNQNNMDMLFNPKKTKEKEILCIIYQALATKCKTWSNSIKQGCKNKKVNPFRKVKDKIQDIDRAADIFEVESIRLKGRDS